MWSSASKQNVWPLWEMRGMYWQKWNIVFRNICSLVCYHLEIPIVAFSLAYNQPSISPQAASPVAQKQPCSTAMLLL